jgi:probable lipoprotein (TIGR04455 family)
VRRIALVLPLFALAACGPVKSSFVRPDYEQVDRTKTVRLAVVTSPLPAQNEKIGALWSEIARKYTNDHRDFIVKVERAGEAMPDGLCADLDTPIEGVLHLAPKVAAAGDGVEASVNARLTRCRDKELVWSAEAGGSWPSDDATLVEVRKHYVEKYGPEVSAFVAPTFQLLRAVLETLPKPALDDAGVMEKIDLE